MRGASKRFAIIVAFTGLLIALVNATWWFAYRRTSSLLEDQLSRRLQSQAATAAASLAPGMIDSLMFDEPEAFLRVIEILDDVRRADSLAEVFILDDDYRYLATTQLEHDSLYFATALNGPYIDSILFGLDPQVVVTETYRTGDLYLKSAFSPVYDSDLLLVGVLGVEASVDYFDSLSDLKSTLLYASGLSLAGGLVLGVLFLALQRRINRAEQRLFLAETESFLGRMVSVVAHELKNPMMIIRAAAERIQKQSLRVGEKSEEPEYIVEEIDRLNQIVSGYLEFSRTGGALLGGDVPEEFDVRELVASLRSHINQKYADRQPEWIADSNQAPVRIVGYRRSLRQVLLNLLINGVESCLQAETTPAVGIEIEASAGGVGITVIDRGPGMTRSQQRRVRDPFYTTKHTGSGLGLFISNRLIAEMGGRLDIDSAPGSGTKVIITLPQRPKR